MKPTELKIGNYLHCNSNYVLLIVIEITKNSFITEAVDRSKFPLPKGWQAEQIPLTEEWLLKFGFEKQGSDFMKSGIIIWNCLEMLVCDKNGVVITTVHQLQNLYFALTNKELTITQQ